MIVRRVEIKKYGWTLHVYCAVRSYFVEDILQHLADIDCPRKFLRQAERNMRDGKLNRGPTYSNYRRRETVLVVGLASSPGEYANSIVHELWHFAVHVALALGLDMEGEEPAYLIGETMRELLGYVAPLLCCSHSRA